MIYPYIRVPIPELGGYRTTRNKVVYLYVYYGERVVDENSESSRHPRAKMIGRIEHDDSGNEVLMPNTSYYEVMNLPLPQIEVMEGAGRKPYKPKPEPLNQRELYSEYSLGYGLTILLLSIELKLSAALESAFGVKVAQQILSLAAFMCEKQRSSFAELELFLAQQYSVQADLSLGRREAGQLLVELAKQPDKRGKFYSLWIASHQEQMNKIFYDVTSFSTYSGQIIMAKRGYNRDHEQMIQVNEGLFCGKETGLPLFMCSYDGSLVDCQNFNYALRRAKEHNLKSTKRNTVLVVDGGFRANNFDWAHFLGYDLIVGVSCKYYSSVKKAFLNWADNLTEKDAHKVWSLDEQHCYISSRVPLTMGNVDGYLIMYRDMSGYAFQLSALTRKRDSLARYLKSLKSVPEVKNFESWAKSFLPFFRVSKAKGRKGFTFEENQEEFQAALSLCGNVTLFVSGEKLGSDRDILADYRSKESVEDCFDTTKNGLCDKRLHVHGDSQVTGKLFVMFIALILRRSLHYRLRDPLKQYSLTDEDAIRELEQICFTRHKDGWHLKDAISKLQKDLLTGLGLNYSMKIADDKDKSTKKPLNNNQ